ncbi:Outer membrane biogenesis protein BamB, partial [Durusdinium trenchii]
MNGRLYLLTTANHDVPTETQEKVVCLDANTGETLWEYAFNVYLSDVPVERVGWSSVTADPETGNVYALGVCGYFCCLDAETGENNVIVSAVIIGYGETAKPTHRYMAFDKTNGQSVWMSGTRVLPHDTTYSAPVLAVIEGELQMIFASGDGGIHGFQPRTGKPLWSYDLSGHGMNASPLVVGKYVYCGHSEENLDTTEMGGMVCLDASKRGNLNEDGEVWRITELFAGRTSPMMIDGRLYIADDRAKLHCLNPETGEALGKPVRLGTMMRSNLLYADGKIFANEVNGRCYVLKPTEDGAEILHRLRLPSGEESHGSPISWNSHLYIPTTGSMYCVAKPD